MKKTTLILIIVAVWAITGAVPAFAAQRELRNYGTAVLGLATPDNPDFSEHYRHGFSGALGYGTKMTRNNRHWFVYGEVGYDQFRPRDPEDFPRVHLYNVNANARWYFGVPAEKASGYVGAGPGVYWDKDGKTWLGGNIAAGGDFPVGSDWSVNVDISQHFLSADDNNMFATFRVGASYWFW